MSAVACVPVDETTIGCVVVYLKGVDLVVFTLARRMRFTFISYAFEVQVKV